MSRPLKIIDDTARRRRSEAEAVEAGFNLVADPVAADVIGFHQGEQGIWSGFSERSEWSDKLILVFGGSPVRPGKVDSQSGRVLGLAFAISRESRIPRATWRRIAAQVRQTEDGLRWTSSVLEEARPDCLSALSILCQGFLATRGHESLEGWGELSSKVQGQILKHRRRPELLDVAWWLRPFEMKGESLEETADRLEETLEEEWWAITGNQRLAPTVKDLVAAIRDGCLGRLEEQDLALRVHQKIKDAFDEFYS